METYDAIIAGFGPTGATLANLLGAMGMKVAVVEREKEIYDKPRAITADHEAMRAFQAAGLADQIAVGTCPHPGTDFVGVSGDVIKRFYPMSGTWPLAWEPTFMFYQPDLEAILRDGVKRFSGVEVFLEHAVSNHRQDEHGVEVEVVARDGAARFMRGKTLLACDGARSGIRSRMQSPIHDLDFDEWWVVVDARLHGDVELPQRCVQYCRPSRPGTYIVGPDRLRRWEIKVMPGEAPESFNDPEHVQKVLASFVDTSALEVQRVAIYRFHAVVAEQWRDGNVFLLGDAAHQMPPFLGQGLCAGVRDAYNLAWKLDAVFKGKADDSLLDTYGQERRPHVQTVVEHAKSFGLIIGELGPDAALARDQRLLAELATGQATTVRQAFIPGFTDGLIHKGHDGKPGSGAGKLFPQPWVSGNVCNRTRLDDLVRGNFYLVCLDATVAGKARCGLDAIVALADSKVIVLGNAEEAGVPAYEEEGGLIRQWLTEHGLVAAIVRPDGVAWGGVSHVDGLTEMLQTLGALLDPSADADQSLSLVCNAAAGHIRQQAERQTPGTAAMFPA